MPIQTIRVFRVLCPLLLLTVAAAAQDQAQPRVLIALSSFRERPLHPKVHFFEWTPGTTLAKAAGLIAAADLVVDTHPSLAQGGRLCATASELENNLSQTRVWSRESKADVLQLDGLNIPEAVQIGATLSADGKWLAFAGLRRGPQSGWNLFLYDLQAKKLADLAVNTDEDEHSPTLSGDGRLLAFVSNRPGGTGLADVYVLDRSTGKLLPLPGLNSARSEQDPSLSADGRWLAFTSERPGGTGSRDVYLYDLAQSRLVALPGLNGIGPDQTPALSPDGRYLAFVAERVSGEGERDVYLYDRQVGRTIPLTGLNSKTEDFDPALIYAEN